MKNRRGKKLFLGKETVAHLSARDLSAVGGGSVEGSCGFRTSNVHDGCCLGQVTVAGNCTTEATAFGDCNSGGWGTACTIFL